MLEIIVAFLLLLICGANLYFNWRMYKQDSSTDALKEALNNVASELDTTEPKVDWGTFNRIDAPTTPDKQNKVFAFIKRKGKREMFGR